MGFFSKFKKNKPSKFQAEDYMVRMNDEQLTVTLPNGSNTVLWKDINKINFRQTTEGPFYPDVFLQICSDNATVELPIDAADYEMVFDRVSKFEGFDFKATIQVMTSVPETEYVIPVWGDTSGASTAPPTED